MVDRRVDIRAAAVVDGKTEAAEVAGNQVRLNSSIS